MNYDLKYAKEQGKFIPNYDPDYTFYPSKFKPVPDPKVRLNGTTRIVDFDYNFDKNGFHETKKGPKPNNKWKEYFYRDRRQQIDPYLYYQFAEIPSGAWAPRSQANLGEYYKDIQNENFFRRENEYELQNNVIHPTHVQQISPERVAADPNQAIYNYYVGFKDVDTIRAARITEFSRRRARSKRDKFKMKQQMFMAFEDGYGTYSDELEPLYW